LSESIIFQQYTDISLQNGSQVHKENPASIDVSDELHQKAEQVCLFSALQQQQQQHSYVPFLCTMVQNYFGHLVFCCSGYCARLEEFELVQHDYVRQ
jgi:predicted GTPase